MAAPDTTAAKILEAIDRHLDAMAERRGGTVLPAEILRLAEAYAWIVQPAQPHGPAATPPK
jgi:hypothetical protein